MFKKFLNLDNQIQSKPDLSKIDEKLRNQLMPFQQEGIW